MRYGYARLFTDEPFINEMCLMVLAALHHQVERELVLLAARANAGATITSQQYRTNVKKWQSKPMRARRSDLDAALALHSFAEWNQSIETLRLLANFFKHDADARPNEKLLKYLRLPTVAELKAQDELVDGYMAASRKPPPQGRPRGLCQSLERRRLLRDCR